MADLYLGFAILTVVSAVAFWGAIRIGRFVPPSRCDLLALLLVSLMLVYMGHLWHNIRIAQLLPFSNVVVVGNWFPPAAAFLAGLTWIRIPTHRNRRSLMVGGLALAGVYSMVHPLLGDLPACSDCWTGNVCLQTSSRTCSAASAATLLRACGIETSEFEMAQLCLTRRGTTWPGLYRGLKRKTSGTEWDVEVFQCTLEELPRMTAGPVLLSVGVDTEAQVDPEYISDGGWVPGTPHTVVLFRYLTPELVVVGDPAIGRELWSKKDLEILWHGEGVRLVRRQQDFQVAQHGAAN